MGAPARMQRLFVTVIVLLAIPAVLYAYFWGAFALRKKRIESQPAMVGPVIDWGLIGGDNAPEYWWGNGSNLKNVLLEGVFEGVPLHFHVSTNEIGFRDRSFGPKSDMPRFLALGDSTTFGHGVEDNESWPKQLEQALEEDGWRAEVVNGGVCGYTSYQGWQRLLKYGPQLQPDLVFVTFGHNESSSRDNLSDYECAQVSRMEVNAAKSYVAERRKGPMRPRLSVEEYKHTLGNIKEACDQLGAKMVLIAWPLRDLLNAPDMMQGIDNYYTATLEAAKELHVDAVDLAPVFKEDVSVIMDAEHAKPSGNRKVAKTLEKYLVEKGLVKKI